MESLLLISKRFQLASNAINVVPLGEGFINDTFVVETEKKNEKYLLQRKNRKIFTDVPAMMNNIAIVSNHINVKVSEKGGDPMRESLTLISSTDGKLYYEDEEGEFWAMCLFIPDSISYEKADTIQLAYQGGRGVGMFQSMVADLQTPLTDILPGFHNIAYRFQQWDAALAKDPVGRKATVLPEIEWIENRRDKMLQFWQLIADGRIPQRVTHNDTKITNILFDSTDPEKVLCMIDLDTVLQAPCLYDFGDAIRSYANTGFEDDSQLEKVSLDLTIFQAFTRGYLSETVPSFLTEIEVEYLAFSVKYITFEQVLRFLMDFIDGDRYYKIKDPVHNLTRTRAQYKLLEDIEKKFEQMKRIIQKIAKECRK
jgi:hypothetical protein